MSKAKPVVTTIDLCFTSEDSQTADSDISNSIKEVNMQTDQDDSASVSHKKTSEQSDSDLLKNSKRGDRKSESKDKPRIVITFRSEKPGAKSSSMKIVSTEEKHEEVSPRRSTRLGTKGESDYECEVSIKSDKSISQPVSEAEETFESSPPKRPQRATRNRVYESDSTWSAKKESQCETSVSRPSRRIKPTAKILANQEMQGETHHRPLKEGVRTRSTRSAAKIAASENDRKHGKSAKDPTSDIDLEDIQSEKLEHLEGLGLKARDSHNKSKDHETDYNNRDAQLENDDQDFEEEQESEEEVDDDLEVINKLLEEDTEDEDYVVSTGNTKKRAVASRPRRRAAPTTFKHSDYYDSTVQSSKRKRLRSDPSSDEEEEEEEFSNAAEAETAEASSVEAAEPDAVTATCLCTEPTNMYAAPDDLPEPVFCQAVSSVDSVRVGCCRGAARGAGGALLPLARCGPRAPFLLLCDAHHAQLRRHLCCPTCGLFCTQGSFVACPAGHVAHAECAVGGAVGGAARGCPHCGVRGAASLRSPPANTALAPVTLAMTCSNKRIYLPTQREQCTPAFLSFAPLDPLNLPPQGPIIPEDLLPSSSVDIAKLCKEADEEVVENEATLIQRILDGIVSGETVELIPKIVSARACDLNAAALVHAAARRGRLLALHALRGAGAALDALDADHRTPLMAATLALLDKSSKDKTQKPSTPIKEDDAVKTKEIGVKMEVENTDREPTLAEVKEEINLVDDVTEKNDNTTEAGVEKSNEQTTVTVQDTKLAKEVMSEENKVVGEKDGGRVTNSLEEDLLKVIRYLVAAGADLNIAGPEGMTALHEAAQLGGAAVCDVILSNSCARVDAADAGGWTPLVHAAENKHRDVVKLLLSHGADPCLPDHEGNSALHWCALAGDAPSLQLLLLQAASVDQPNAAGDTPLHIAGRQNHYACVVTLLARGARTDIENSQGELPLEVCSGACRAAVSLHMQMAICAGAQTVTRILNSDISNGREMFPIPCVNSLDDEKEPGDYTYVAELLTPTILTVDNTINTLKGCSCSDECGGACACTAVSVSRWYRGGRLREHFPLHDAPALFECNATCRCNPKRCTNNPVSRLLRRGSVWARCEVYRCGGARGWGLRCCQLVRRGAPVAAYTGELLLADDADRRPTDQYVFAIDVKPDLLEQCVDKRQFCVDASQYGGAARFMNHSCRPTLAPLRVLTTTRDLRLPTIALFATADLPPNTPLTFDYGDKFWSVKSKYMSCECGEPNCRYPTKSTEEIES